MLSWLFAKFYDSFMADAEKKCLRDWRSTLLSDLSGDVLELGAGTGANLAYYPSMVKHLWLAEPDLNMRQKLEAKLSQYPQLKTTVLDDCREFISLSDESLDSVVCTLVLCTVDDPKKTLSEIYRILKPNGVLVFIEHVAAESNPVRLKWQKRFEPFWKIIGCGCHLTRRTEQSILQAGFGWQEITRQSMRGVPSIVRPTIYGKAIK